MKNNQMWALAVLFTVAANAVHAHPGHDHGHWMSSGVHAVLAMAIVATITAVVVLLKRKQKANRKQKIEA